MELPLSLPTAVPLSWFLILSAILFMLGIAGFLLRRNIITVFMSIELMLNAVNLTFVTFSYRLKQVDGHIFSFFVMVVAAAEAAVGLAIILTVFKNRQTLEIDADVEVPGLNPGVVVFDVRLFQGIAAAEHAQRAQRFEHP